jgi:hypothetical protein
MKQMVLIDNVRPGIRLIIEKNVTVNIDIYLIYCLVIEREGEWQCL